MIRQEDSRRYNSIRLISPEGTIIGNYDKRALWGWDLDHFERGSALGIFDIDGIKSHLLTRAVEKVMTVVSINSISDFQTAPTAVFDVNGHVIREAPRNKEHLLVYDYLRPDIGFGEKGRIEDSFIAMRS